MGGKIYETGCNTSLTGSTTAARQVTPTCQGQTQPSTFDSYNNRNERDFFF